MVCLRNEVNKMQNEEIVSHVTKKGLHLLLDVVLKWINIPFQVPRRFFKIRPCIGSELFAFTADAGKLKWDYCHFWLHHLTKPMSFN
ncbi:hypothetical protein SLA2020_040950 [Shorea laevis]